MNAASEMISIRGIAYHTRVFGEGPAVLWLHGFTGSHETFVPIAERLSGFTHVLIDLPGHGRTTTRLSPARIRTVELAVDLDLLMQQVSGEDKYTVVGYSMGGRIAIALAATAPMRLTKLVLESTSPGLEVPQSRLDRRDVDANRAAMIETHGLAAFLAEWERLPLFASQAQAPATALEWQRRIRMQQTGLGLQMSLLGHGTGVQPSYWPHLHRFDFPVHLITGTADEKFTRTAARMLRYLPHAEHWLVKQAGHTIHVEQETQFTQLMAQILQPTSS